MSNSGEQILHTRLPKGGLFEVRLDGRGQTAWCYPQSWFARGMAGCVWRPADEDATTIFSCTVAEKKWSSALEFPDAVGDLALHPDGKRMLVSCWDGKLYLLDRAGRSLASVVAGGPARLGWSKEGRFAVVGTEAGEILRLDGDGKESWRLKLPQAPLPPLRAPVQRVFKEVPVYQVGRVGTEHAYVGDTWLIRTERGGILIDTGGTSGIPFTLQRMESAGVGLRDVRHLLHTHSHGDHCGAGYLWRSMGLQVVAPESAQLTLGWLMPTLSDYGVWAPRPIDVPLRLRRAGDEAEITLAGLKVRAIFVPGHSFDSVLYAVELEGKRVLFTGDIGFDRQDILHRCWGDVEKARAVTEVVRTRVLPWKPDFVFRGHGATADGTAFLEGLVKRSQEAIRLAEKEK
jgi:glyoxylase-like metal-dependent hydrolase (beta-lactamase superfamily II)